EADGEAIEIIDTQKENNLIIHILPQLPEDQTAVFKAVVNKSQRRDTANNHTATHLLDHALREVLGKHVEQKGSLVNADYLRFDFSHFGKMTREELEAVQRMVNRMIRNNLTQEAMEGVGFHEAQAMGAIALFGEKYGETVRVIKFGDSIELCGGTHVAATGQIGQFLILSESAISAGVRRIEAITGEKAEEYIREKMTELSETRAFFSQAKDIRKSVETLIAENNLLNKKLEEFEHQEVLRVKNELKKNVVKLGEINLIAATPSLGSAQAVKDLAYQLKGEISNLFLVLGSNIDGKPLLTVMISEELVQACGLDAAKIVREAGKEIKGGGGGQPFYATAGGKDISGLEAAVARARSFLSDY
ncbi:MAG TPA: DHHA1 domain-containing protein, partial [Prolixibacteraceae bacterium]|nr:DHHA1 domain-containing protein [Prolixibacteraceae bacterium]